MSSSDHASLSDHMRSSSAILGTPRAAVLFALTVFIATTVQVLATPVSALVGGDGEWPFELPVASVLTLLVSGCAVQAAALMFSDRLPQSAVAVVIAVYLALATGLGVPTWLTGMYLVIALALFLLATRRPLVIAVLWLAVTVVAVVGGLFWWMQALGTPFHAAFWWIAAEAARFAAPAAAGTILGLWWAGKVNRMRAAREAAEQARRDHDARVAQAQSTERARIAQELHDVAGQHLAGLISLADAAIKIAPDRPGSALNLLEEVRDEGRFAAASLAGALADLRATSPTSGTVVPDLRNADELVQYWRGRGMAVDLTVSGDIGNLPTVVSTTAYRCMQEALTNAATHSPGSEVTVRVNGGDDTLIVAVVNGAPAATAAHAGLGLGWGLRGMLERVELLRGTMSTQEPDTGGFRVHIEIPTTAS